MEEKERYKLESYLEAFCEIHDTKSDEWYLRKDLVTDLLNQQDKQIADLEAKLAEKDRKNLLLYSMLYTTLEKQDTENVSSRIDQMTGETLDKQSEWFKTNRVCDKLQRDIECLEENYAQLESDYEKANELGLEPSYIKRVIKENEQLKQQLEEKEKVIETILKENEELVVKHNVYNLGDKIQKDKVYSLTGEALELLINLQNQKAIEQLEKARINILCNENFYFENLNKYVEEILDQQINELKGE